MIARSPHLGAEQAHVFLVFAGMLLMLPLVRLLPEHCGVW